MSNLKNFSKLRDKLVYFYPNVTDIQRIVDDAGLRRENINFSISPRNVWHGILLEAAKADQLENLIEIACQDYPAIGAVYHEFLASGGELPFTDSESVTSERPKITLFSLTIWKLTVAITIGSLLFILVFQWPQTIQALKKIYENIKTIIELTILTPTPMPPVLLTSEPVAPTSDPIMTPTFQLTATTSTALVTSAFQAGGPASAWPTTSAPQLVVPTPTPSLTPFSISFSGSVDKKEWDIEVSGTDPLCRVCAGIVMENIEKFMYSPGIKLPWPPPCRLSCTILGEISGKAFIVNPITATSEVKIATPVSEPTTTTPIPSLIPIPISQPVTVMVASPLTLTFQIITATSKLSLTLGSEQGGLSPISTSMTVTITSILSVTTESKEVTATSTLSPTPTVEPATVIPMPSLSPASGSATTTPIPLPSTATPSTTSAVEPPTATVTSSLTPASVSATSTHVPVPSIVTNASTPTVEPATATPAPLLTLASGAATVTHVPVQPTSEPSLIPTSQP